MSYIEKLQKEDQAAYLRYLSKLNVLGINECPYNMPGDIWSNDPTKWPDVQWPDVYHYLTETPGVYTKEAMKNYKSLEAHNFFLSGWVQTVFHIKISSTLLIKAKVRPSFRVNDEPHQPWAAVAMDGTIVAAHCDCKAGLGESCSHVAAMLFKVEAAVRNGYTKKACTDQPCAWNKCYTKSVEPAPIHEIKFYKESAKQKLKNSKRARKPPPPTPAKEKQKSFLQSLTELSSKPVGLSIFKETAHVFKTGCASLVKRLPISLSSLFSDTHKQLTPHNLHKKCDEIAENLQASSEECEYLKQSTINQSESVLWHDQRVGRITASVAHDVMHTNFEKPAKSIIKKICHPNKKQLQVPAILWGCEKESVAFSQYKTAISSQHEKTNVLQTGLGIVPAKPFIGASPDGIVTCKCCGTGVVEIKSPFALKDKTDKEMVLSQNFYLDENYKLKANSKYYTQVQLQMYVYECSFCHFIVWSNEACIITSVSRDDEFIDNLIESLTKFWKTHCLPELLTRNLMSENNQEVSETFYCYCQKPWNEDDGTDMVGCDATKCPYKWIHYTCAKIKRPPKGKWYCKSCKKKKL